MTSLASSTKMNYAVLHFLVLAGHTAKFGKLKWLNGLRMGNRSACMNAQSASAHDACSEHIMRATF